MECGRKDIAAILYASCNIFSRGSSPYASLRRPRSKANSTQLQRTGSFTSSRSNQGNRCYQLAPSPPTRSRHSSTASVASQKRSTTGTKKWKQKHDTSLVEQFAQYSVSLIERVNDVKMKYCRKQVDLIVRSTNFKNNLRYTFAIYLFQAFLKKAVKIVAIERFFMFLTHNLSRM